MVGGYLLACLLVSAQPVAAPAPAAPTLAEVRADYEDLMFEEALQKTQRLLEGDNPPSTKARILIWRALILYGMEDLARGEPALREALELNAALELPVSNAPPALLQRYEELRAELAPEAPAPEPEPAPAPAPEPEATPAPAPEKVAPKTAPTPVLTVASSGEPSVLVLDLEAARIDPSEAKVMNDLVGQSVTRKKVKVTTAADVRRMADVESQKMLLGCESDTSCLADLAGDFGARYVLYGSVAQLGELYVIQLTLFDAEKAEAVDRVRVETRDLSSVTAEIDTAVDRVFTSVVGSPVAPVAEPISSGVWITLGGVVLIAGGVTLGVLSLQPAEVHNTLQSDIGDEQRAFEAGDASALDRAHQLQTEAGAAALNHLLLLGGGVALGVVGVGVTTLGIVSWE